MFETKKVLDVFNEQASNWDIKKKYILEKSGESRRLFRILDDILDKNHTVLDVGSGTGKVSQYIQEKFPDIFSISIDVSIEMLKILRSKNVHCFRLLCDANRIGILDQVFDVVICQQVLHHIKDPQNALKEMFRVTKRNGFVISLSVGSQYQDNIFPYDSGLGMTSDLLGRVNQDEIAKLTTSAGFHILDIINDYFSFSFNSFDNYYNFLVSIGTINKIHKYYSSSNKYRMELERKILASYGHNTINIRGHYITVVAKKL